MKHAVSLQFDCNHYGTPGRAQNNCGVRFVFQFGRQQFFTTLNFRKTRKKITRTLCCCIELEFAVG
jgi:hypothetical protein